MQYFIKLPNSKSKDCYVELKNKMADKIIRIGTRDSELLMASTYGREKLNDLGYKTEIVAVKAQGILFLTNLFMNSESLEFLQNIGYCHDQWSG
jgi:hypothetical protein